MSKSASRLAYLAKIASLYYDQEKTQQEIADEVGITRSAISRLLTEAREEGIVEIVVHYPWKTSRVLEESLTRAFALRKVRVLVSAEKAYQDMLQGIGVLAAEYLESVLHDDISIGISWGTALYEMIKAMPPKKLPRAEVVQLIGATGAENISTDGPMLAQLLSQRLGCACRYLHAPLIIDSEVGKTILVQDRSIQMTLERAKKVDIALVGIGTTEPRLYSLLRAGYVTEEETAAIRAVGAVGDICAHHYDAWGRLLDIDINRRVVGITLSALKAVDTVVGVAGGAEKAETILGALRGGHLDVLITDETAARRILNLHLATVA